jgi:hypothetical protein
MVDHAGSPFEVSFARGAGAPLSFEPVSETDLARSSSRERRQMSDPKLVKFNPESLAAFLRRIHPAKTADCVAVDTGVAAETVRGWLKSASRPGCKHLLALIGAYGPEFLVAMFPNAPRWLRAVQRAERQSELESELAAVRAGLADLKRPRDEWWGQGMDAPGADCGRMRGALDRQTDGRRHRVLSGARRVAGE